MASTSCDQGSTTAGRRPHTDRPKPRSSMSNRIRTSSSVISAATQQISAATNTAFQTRRPPAGAEDGRQEEAGHAVVPPVRWPRVGRRRPRQLRAVAAERDRPPGRRRPPRSACSEQHRHQRQHHLRTRAVGRGGHLATAAVTANSHHSPAAAHASTDMELTIQRPARNEEREVARTPPATATATAPVPAASVATSSVGTVPSGRPACQVTASRPGRSSRTVPTPGCPAERSRSPAASPPLWPAPVVADARIPQHRGLRPGRRRRASDAILRSRQPTGQLGEHGGQRVDTGHAVGGCGVLLGGVRDPGRVADEEHRGRQPAAPARPRRVRHRSPAPGAWRSSREQPVAQRRDRSRRPRCTDWRSPAAVPSRPARSRPAGTKSTGPASARDGSSGRGRRASRRPGRDHVGAAGHDFGPPNVARAPAQPGLLLGRPARSSRSVTIGSAGRPSGWCPRGGPPVKSKRHRPCGRWPSRPRPAAPGRSGRGPARRAARRSADRPAGGSGPAERRSRPLARDRVRPSFPRVPQLPARAPGRTRRYISRDPRHGNAEARALLLGEHRDREGRWAGRRPPRAAGRPRPAPRPHRAARRRRRHRAPSRDGCR